MITEKILRRQSRHKGYKENVEASQWYRENIETLQRLHRKYRMTQLLPEKILRRYNAYQENIE